MMNDICHSLEIFLVKPATEKPLNCAEEMVWEQGALRLLVELFSLLL